MFSDGKIHIDFGNCVTGQDVKITHNGKDVSGITRVEIDVKPNNLIDVRLTLSNTIIENLEGGAKSLWMIDPRDGEFKELDNIKFKNKNV